MKKRLVIFAVVTLPICYLSGPFMAGAFSVGDRLGPVFYPEPFHQDIYNMVHETLRNEKPRIPIDGWMYRRPLFYGLPRRLKSLADRNAFIEIARQNQSPALSGMIEMNEKAN